MINPAATGLVPNTAGNTSQAISRNRRPWRTEITGQCMSLPVSPTGSNGPSHLDGARAEVAQVTSGLLSSYPKEMLCGNKRKLMTTPKNKAGLLLKRPSNRRPGPRSNDWRVGLTGTAFGTWNHREFLPAAGLPGQKLSWPACCGNHLPSQGGPRQSVLRLSRAVASP